MKSPVDVAIVGGGIGGLTTALALQREGIAAHVYEQSDAFSELGLGLGLGANALRLLQRLSIASELESIGFRHSAIEYRWGPDGRSLLTLSAGESDGVSELNVHRGQFLRLLARSLPADQLHVGKRCIGVDERRDAVRVAFDDGSSITAHAVIGADGIRSAVRAAQFRIQPKFSGTIAYRGLVRTDRLLNAGTDGERMVFWLGPHRHILTYPITGGTLINIVAFVMNAAPPGDADWVTPADDDEVERQFGDWHDSVRDLTGNLDRTTRWSLYDCDPLPAWSTGRVTLMGDAAHAMLPHQGQGASQAIEDAFVLAKTLGRATNGTVTDRLERYEGARKARAEHVQDISRRTAQAYQSPDAEEQMRGVKSFEAHGDWLRNHDAEREFVEAIDR